MKILKDDTLSLFLRAFGVKDQLHLAVTAFVHFDLLEPDTPLKEQDLWKTLPPLLEPGAALDLGMPKPRPELLVCGSAWAPKGERRPAQPVALRWKGGEKRLLAFGERHWSQGASGAWSLSEPEPFERMPLTWSRAFGGPEFAPNPTGRGIAETIGPDGRHWIPLPNLERPEALLGAPDQRPAPAGLGPLDSMWPPRSKRTGTYDERWKRERWPYFPEDFDYAFFNAAPEDQWMAESPQAGETFELEGMHPEHRLLRSHIPRLRPRLFVTKRPSLEPRSTDAPLFEEVKLRVDTLWVFPDITKGLVLFRGTTPVLDSEYRDLVRIFGALETSGSEPLSLEHYAEEQKRRFHLAVPLDMAPFQEAAKKAGAALREARDLPKLLARIKDRIVEGAPRMPFDPQAMRAIPEGPLAAGAAVLDTLEPMARDLHAQFGHLAEMDLGAFARGRAALTQAGEKASAGIEKGLAAREKALRTAQEAEGRVKARILSLDPALRARAGLDPDRVLPTPKPDPWHDQAFALAVEARRALEADPRAREALNQLGVRPRSLQDHWLGRLAEARTEPRHSWSLDGPAPLELPAGLVLPDFQGSRCMGLALYPDFPRRAREVLVEGSRPEARPRAAALRALDTPLLCAKTRLEALLLEEAIGDACSVLALAGPSAPLSPEAKAALEAAPGLLVCAPRDEAMEAWKPLHPGSRLLPIPEAGDLLEAAGKGLDLRTWVLAALPEAFRKQHDLSTGLPEEGSAAGLRLPPMELPKVDLEAFRQELEAAVQAKAAPQVAQAQARAQEGMARARAALVRMGRDPAFLDQKARPLPVEEIGPRMCGIVEKQREALRASGRLTPGLERHFDEALASISGLCQAATTQYQQGMAQLAEGKAHLAEAKGQAAEARGQVKAALSGGGGERLRVLDREEVLARLAKGRSLAGCCLDGADLAGLDLSKVDFEGTFCRKTTFAKSDLQGARFHSALAQGADFGEARLAGLEAEGCSFDGASFAGARLEGARFRRCTVADADFEGAGLERSEWRLCTLGKPRMKGARLDGIELSLSLVTEGDLTGASLRGAHLHRSILQTCVLDRACLAGAHIEGAQFDQCRGVDMDFSTTRWERGAMGDCRFPAASFEGTNLTHACWRESALEGSTFAGARFRDSMVEGCGLVRARLARLSARGTSFARTDFEEADLSDADLLGASLRKARLVNTDLRRSNCFGVDFYKAVLGETRLEGAELKRTLLEGRRELLP